MIRFDKFIRRHLRILLVVFLYPEFCVLSAEGQNQVNTISFYNTPQIEGKNNEEFSLNVNINYDLTNCETDTIVAEFECPSIYIGSARVEGVGYVDLAKYNQKLIVKFKPQEKSASFLFSVQNLRFQSSNICNKEKGEITGKLFVCGVNVDSAEIGYTILQNNQIVLYEWSPNYNCSSSSPIRRNLSVYVPSYDIKKLPSATITYDYGNPNLKCVGVTYSSDNLFNNEEVIFDTVPNTNQVRFTTDKLSINSQAYFFLYLDKRDTISSSKVDTVRAYASAIFPDCQDTLSGDTCKIVGYEISKDCNYQSIINVPDFIFSHSAICEGNNDCWGNNNENIGILYLQVDNSFKGDLKLEYTDTFTVELDINDTIDIVNFRLVKDWYMKKHIDSTSVEVFYQTNNSSTYISTNYTIGDVISKNTLGISDEDRITKLKVVFPKFPDYTSAKFELQYYLKPRNGSIPKERKAFDIDAYIKYDGEILKHKVVSLAKNSNIYYCSGRILYDYLSVGNGGERFVQGGYFAPNLDPRDQRTKILLLRMDYKGKENVFSFEYEIPQKEGEKFLLLNENPNVKFYYDNDFDETIDQYHSLFKDLDDFKAESPQFDNMSYSINKSTGVIRIDSVNVDTCSNKSFYVGIEVKINQYAKAKEYRSNLAWYKGRDSISTYYYYYPLNPWQIAQIASVSLSLDVACANDKKKSIIELEKGEQFKYYMNITNNSNSDTYPIDSIDVVGILPHVDDIELFSKDSERRGSTTSVACPGVNDISFKLRDDLTNNIISLENNKFQIRYATDSIGRVPCLNSIFNAPGLDKTEPSDCYTPQEWHSNCPSTLDPAVLRITTNDTLSLMPYHTLIVEIKDSTLNSSVIDDVANFDFTAKVKNRQGHTLDLSLSNRATILLSSESSCAIEPPCKDCLSSFAPIPGKEYVFSAWVQDPAALALQDTTYENSCSVSLIFKLSDSVEEDTITIRPSGPIIEGWQRIQQAFTIPPMAYNMQIRLNNDKANNNDVFFDDIRFHPFNSSMKSYVYDPVNLRLSAELDDENYATFYEYDEEGALIRVKKETERGIMTIREARQAKPKIQQHP